MYRANSRIRRLKSLHGIPDWDWVYHRSVFAWAGHVARMRSYDKQRSTYQVLCYRNWAWIQKVAQDNGGNQTHGRRLRIWRWERPIYKYFGEDCWEDVAQDSHHWSCLLDEMATWRCNHR